MRKTNIALLAAVVMASPIAFADGYDSYPSNSDDIVIDGSKNDIYKSSLDLELNKTETKYNVGNEDNDLLYISDVGNDKSKVYEDNSTYLATKTVDIDIDIDKYLASTYLSGEVMDASVTYGGACCDKHRGGGSGSTNVEVNQTNMMVGSFNSASGISIAGQNVGNNSLVQQTTSTNAVLMGSGDVVSPGGGGHGGY